MRMYRVFDGIVVRVRRVKDYWEFGRKSFIAVVVVIRLFLFLGC